MTLAYQYGGKEIDTLGRKKALYLNITNRCTNDCVFCVGKKGRFFYGQDLHLDREPRIYEVLDSIASYPDWDNMEEIVICGWGEPLLRLNDILGIAKRVKEFYNGDIKIKVNTNGTIKQLYPNRNIPKELSDAGVDRINVSLNAETPEKYNIICRPRLKNSYENMMEFLHDLKRHNDDPEKHKLEVRLSVVDISECAYLPDITKLCSENKPLPKPNKRKCKEMSKSFGFDFVVKKLLREA